MRTKIITLLSLTAAIACGCSEDFYNSMNETPTLTTSVNLSTTDTIKTSAKSTKRTYQFDVSSTDPNGNIDYLSATANTANLLLNGENVNGINVPIELSKEKYEFNRLFEVVPTANGLHTIKVNVHDAFKTSKSIEKYVYSFDNMRPKLGITYTLERRNEMEVHYNFDFSTSYDRDTKWGGAIDSVFIKVYFAWGPGMGFTEEESTMIMALDVATYGLTREEPIFDNGSAEIPTDIYFWVKDNENTISDTLHIPYVHVE